MKFEIPFNALKPEYAEIGKEIDEAVHRVLHAGWFILGPELESFEREFAEYLHVSHVIGVGSGTDALHIALQALDIGPGDEVITVSHSFIATALAVTFTGAVPVFVDIDPKTYTMDPEAVRAAITPRTRAIIPVHLYGQSAHMDPLMQLASDYHLAVIEDACQAHGAMYKGRMAGTIGHIGCFSFYPTKNMGAYGDGGACVTNDQLLAGKLRALRNYGQEKKYYHSSIGTNSRLDELQAAILKVKLRHLDSNNARRQSIAKEFSRIGNPLVHLPVTGPGCTHIYHIYAIRVENRDDFRHFLKMNGVETLIHYPVPIHRQQAYAKMNMRACALPVTDQVAGEEVSLPMFPQLSPGETGYLVDLIDQYRPGLHR